MNPSVTEVHEVHKVVDIASENKTTTGIDLNVKTNQQVHIEEYLSAHATKERVLSSKNEEW